MRPANLIKLEKPILIIGKQGSGKTTYLNRFLNENKWMYFLKIEPEQLRMIRHEYSKTPQVVFGRDKYPVQGMAIIVDDIHNFLDLSIVLHLFKKYKIASVCCTNTFRSWIPEEIFEVFDVKDMDKGDFYEPAEKIALQIHETCPRCKVRPMGYGIFACHECYNEIINRKK